MIDKLPSRRLILSMLRSGIGGLSRQGSVKTVCVAKTKVVRPSRLGLRNFSVRGALHWGTTSFLRITP